MTEFRDREFVTQYAIRTPSGELWCNTYSSPWSGISGLFSSGDEAPKQEPPAVWYNREQAQRQLDGLKEQASRIGVLDWFGVVVQRICSPFTTDDPGEHFATDLEEWLRNQ